MTYWLLNASTLEFSDPQTLGRGTSAGLWMLLAGPWAHWWLL